MSEAVLDQSARVTRIPTPVALPGHCAICGKTDHPEGFAATDNLDFEFFGTFYLCADCVGDYARVFGFLSSAEFAGLLEKQQSMHDELEILREAVANLENILDAYAKLRHNPSIPDHRDARNVNPSAYADEGTTVSIGEQLQLRETEQPVHAESVDGPVNGGTEQSNESDESGNQQRPYELPDVASNVTKLFDDLGI